MPTTTTLPNMNLVVPVVGNETGPQWATDINACFNTVDQHDHTSGNGVQITPAGLSISTDLTFQNNSATNLKALVLTAQSSFATNKSLYVIGNEVYFRDGAGNQVQITNGGSVNAGAGSITGLPSGTASVTYSAVGQSYTFQSATLTPAYIDGASLRIRNLTASSKMVQLDPPAAMAADTTITLPTIPASTKVLSISATGALATGVAGTVDSTDLASNAVTTAKIANGQVTPAKMGAANYTLSNSSGSFTSTSGTLVAVTNLSVSITTNGRPVMVRLVADTGNDAYIKVWGSGTVAPTGGVRINNNGANIYLSTIAFTDTIAVSAQGTGSISAQGINTGTGQPNSGITAGANSGIAIARSASSITVPAASIGTIDFPAAGTYTYDVYVYTSGTIDVHSCKLVAIEM